MQLKIVDAEQNKQKDISTLFSIFGISFYSQS